MLSTADSNLDRLCPNQLLLLHTADDNNKNVFFPANYDTYLQTKVLKLTWIW